MRDKERIEEMARDMCGDTQKNCDDCFEAYEKYVWKSKITNREFHCEPIRFAKALYNADYRKIPEGSVVISREEYEELKQAKTLLEFREETIKYLEDANIRYAKALELKVNKKERKETAREILNAMLDIKPDFSLLDGCTPSEFMRSVDLATNIIFQAVKEQAKRYDVEVEL